MKVTQILASIYAIIRFVMDAYRKVKNYMWEKELDKAVDKAVDTKDTSDIERLINK